MIDSENPVTLRLQHKESESLFCNFVPWFTSAAAIVCQDRGKALLSLENAVAGTRKMAQQ